eukprot:1719106-Heterocapsa_arctica.AAC.1
MPSGGAQLPQASTIRCASVMRLKLPSSSVARAPHGNSCAAVSGRGALPGLVHAVQQRVAEVAA